jgi:two-component system sensor histidine kinase HydH
VKNKRFILTAIILLIILGVFMALGIINSRREMMNLIKEEARSFLHIVASTQENSIFAEGTYEDEIIDKMIGICDYLETISLNSTSLSKINHSFGLNSIVILDPETQEIIMSSGNPLEIISTVFDQKEKIIYEYFDIGQTKNLRFVYKTKDFIYQIEVSAQNIQRFRQEFGINKMITQLTANPMIKYLVLQDKKGIIFATSNIQTITKIEDDPALARIYEKKDEISRIMEFEGKNILELVRPFIVNDETYGLFRIGVSLDGYYRHVRATERQLIILFIILVGAGLILFYFFLKYQAYVDLREVFNKTLSAVEDGILMTDQNGVIIGVNKAFTRLLNIEEKILINRDYSTLFRNDELDIIKVLQKGMKIIDERSMFTRDIMYSTYPLLNTKGNINGAVSVLRDVTELRRFEKEREETERLKYLGNLVANFAHEIRNPLNGLSIAAQRLNKEFDHENKEYRKLVSTIKQEIETLNRFLNDFLSLARPRIKENREFDLSGLLQSTVNFIEGQTKNAGIELKCNIKKNCKIVGNMNDFKRALLNILLNSIEALANVRTHKKVITIDLAKQSGKAVLQIKDNGKGMDEQEKERIFTPYYTTKKKGTGLGLYIAQKIIKDHNGSIEVQSTPGKGTAFYISIAI